MSASILVSKRHAGNDVLKYIKRCAYTITTDIEPDFELGRTACALYLSLRYHATKPNYIYDRITALGSKYDLRILLVIVDHIEYESYLKELSKLCIRCGITLMLAWSIEDAAAYLERYKLSEHQAAELIMGQPTNPEYDEALDQYMIDALAECKTINRTDASSIVGLFDKFERICNSTPEDIAICPGVGLQKANRLYNLLHRKVKKEQTLRSRGVAGTSSHQLQEAINEEEENERLFMESMP